MDKPSALNAVIPVSLTRRLLSYLICVVIAGQPVLPAAGAVITPSGSGTQMDQAANGVPVVNIAAPNQAGISHNKFQDYNVGQEGLILNNATGKLNPTQLGGLIQNNPNLKAGQEAKGIINEVTGTNRSQLQGYTEVAGKAANVMVANPYGITCNGCGFINTPQATLTTGRPVFDASGNLQALDVTKGSIILEGKGIDASSSDALSIISRATEVNAAIHAKDLKVIAGANRVNADGSVQAQQGEGAAPTVAVDTGALGGMYANRIHLVSSEKGVGVNLGDLNARQGDITLDANGWLTLHNSLAGGALTARGEDLALTGDHKAGGNMTLTSQGDMALSNGSLNSDGDLVLNASGTLTHTNENLAAGRDAALAAQNISQDAASQMNAARDITTNARDTLKTQGQITAGQNLTASATLLTQEGKLLAQNSAQLNAAALNNRGAVQGGALSVGSTTLSNAGTLLSGGSLTVNTRDFSQSGSTGAKGTANITASGRLDNSGTLISDDALTLSAAQLNNSGTLSGAKGLTVTADSLTASSASVTHSDGDLVLNAQDAMLAGETSAGGAVTLTGRSLKTATTAQTQGSSVSVDVLSAQLDGTQTASGSMTLTARDSLTHRGKTSAALLTVNTQGLTNSGVLTADALSLNAPQVVNSGLIQGEKTLSLVATLLDNRSGGMVYTPSTLSLAVQDLKNAGIITSDAALSLSGTQLTNSGELSGSVLDLNYGTLNNATGGLLLAQGNNRMTAQSLSNAGTVAGDHLALKAGDLTSTGLLQGESSLSLTAGMLNLLAGSRTLTNGTLSLSGTTFTTAGQLQGQNVSLNARDWRNRGSLLATGNLSATLSGQLTSTGDIMSQGGTTLKATGTDNQGNLLAAGDLSLSGNALSNSGIVQGGTLTVNEDSVTNSGTLTGIAALRLASRLDMAAPLLTFANNSGGALLTSGVLAVTAGSISNAGQWQGKQILINADNLTNSGAVQAADALTASLTGNMDSTSGGKITSNGAMALSALALNNSGQWIAKNLTLKANTLSNNGEVTGVERLSFTLSQRLDNLTDGKLLSAGVLALNSGNVVNAGHVQGSSTILTTGQLVNSGRLQGESLVVNVSGELNNTGSGVLLSQNTLGVTADTLKNQGILQGSGETSVTGTTRVQNDGSLLSGSKLTLTTPELSVSSTGLVQGVTLLLSAVTALNNGRIIATGNAELRGATLSNSGTLQGADLLVGYKNLSSSGTVLGTSSLTVKGDTVTSLASGKLFSTGNLLLDSQTFDSEGQVVSLGDVTLNLISSLTHSGTLAAGRTLTVMSQNAITNNSVMQGNTLSLTAGGAFTNNGRLTTGDGRGTFSANSILLNASGSLQAGGDVQLTSRGDITVNGFAGTAGSLTIAAAGTLLNTALIYAAKDMWLLADRLHNRHGDILAGSDLVMQKNAAGAASTEIINTSGSMETQNGDLLIRTAHLLNEREGNNAATETTENDLSGIKPLQDSSELSMGFLHTSSSDFNGSVLLVPVELLEQGSYGLWSYKASGLVVCDENGNNCGARDYIQYIYGANATGQIFKVIKSQTKVSATAGGAPARLFSGRDMLIQADTLDNVAGNIISNRNMTLSGNTLNNQSQVTGVYTDYYTYQEYGSHFYTYYPSGGIATGPADVMPDIPGRYTSKPKPYIPVKLIGHETSRTQESISRGVIQAGGSINATFTGGVDNSALTANAGLVSNDISTPVLNILSRQSVSDAEQVQPLTLGDTVSVDSPQWRDALADALQGIAGGSSLSAQNGSGGNTSLYPLPSGNNGYFVPSTDPDSPYLITVNPKLDGLGQLDQSLFGDLYSMLGVKPGQAPQETRAAYTDKTQFLGASYFLNRLGLQPEKDYRFLGDAAFDTRYVSNAVLNMTGSRYINGVGSDLEQMQYLMDSAAAQQKKLGLQFGVALTAEQISHLTGSILWWESATINGQTVMIPKVYLSPEDVTVHSGSIISAGNVQLKGGKVTNSGSTLTAQNALSVDASSLSNLDAGLISAGGSLNLKAAGDINNISSAISGKTVSLESISGSINNITRAEQATLIARGKSGSVNIADTLTGSEASIRAADSLRMTAGNDITLRGAALSSGGDLLMQAGNNITVTENQTNSAYTMSGFGANRDTGQSSAGAQGSSITAGGNLVQVAGNNLTVTASSVSAGENALLSAGNDLSLNAAATHQTQSDRTREAHTTGAVVSTVTAGDSLTLSSGRDISSQAAKIAAENNITLQAGRDVNLLAEASTEGNSDISKNKKEINESVRRQGTEIASGGHTTIVGGRDVTAQASSVTAKGDIGVAAGRDVSLNTATESDYHYKEQTKTKKGFLSKKTTHTIEEDSVTRESGSLLSGDNVSVVAGNNLLVKGSAVAGDGDVALSAGNNVDIVAATNTDITWRFKEEKRSGLMGTGGIGITVGSSKSTHDLREAGTTQSQSFSTVGSTGGNVVIAAGNQAHIGGADIIAQKDISLTGDSVVIEPGHDKRTRDEKFEQKSSGLTVAMSGAAGSAVNGAVTTAQSAKQSSDSRLAALQGTQAALSGVQAGQAVALDQAKGSSDKGNNNTVGISASIGSQSSKSSSHMESGTTTGSTLSAGNNVTIKATGSDITVAGSQIKAGKDVTLDAARDVNLIASQDTQQTTGKNSSSGGSVGVGVGVGSGGAGISISANANSSKGHEQGNGVWQNETTVDAGNRVTITTGRDATIAGAQVSGDRVVADIGRDLTIASTRDSDHYDSKQTSVSGGVGYTFGAGTASGSLSVSRDKMTSDYDSVQEQSGLFAGSGGFDVTVGNHTQLDGGVIASAATADKNRLDTGTLGFSDIHNQADFKTEHQGAGISSGGSIGGQFAGNMANGLLAGGGNSGHAEGTTKAAVSDGTIIVRDQANQKQDIAELSRDTDHANGSIGPIFDKEKEQQRLQEVQLIGQIGSQAADIANTQGEINGLNAGRKELADKGITEPDANASDEAKAAYQNALRGTDAYKTTMAKYGTGSDLQRGIQAATAALQGLAGSDLTAALAGASAPELANYIGHGSGLSDEAAVVAHAILGGAVAALQGNSVAAGAAGAATGELAARAIAGMLYPDVKDLSKLSEEQKQTVSALATIAAGMAGGLAGDSTGSAVASGQAGKNAVENNALGSVLAAANKQKPGTVENYASGTQAAIKEACSGGTPVSCETAVAAMGSAMAWPLLPVAAATTSLIGGGANAAVGLLINGEVNPNDVILGYWTGAFTAGTGLWGTMAVNAGSGATSSYLKGDDPLKGGLISGATSGLGYGAGKLVELPFDKVLNPMKPWKDWIWTDVGMGISKPLPINPVPGMAGNASGSAATEILNDQASKADAKFQKGNQK